MDILAVLTKVVKEQQKQISAQQETIQKLMNNLENEERDQTTSECQYKSSNWLDQLGPCS